MNLELLNTERGIEIHDKNLGFIAECCREDEGKEIVKTYNNATSLMVHECHTEKEVEWGLASNANPNDDEFFPMDKEVAFKLLSFLNAK